MEKKVLSEIALYTGDVKMPTGFEIDKRFLALKSLEAGIYDKEFIHSKEWEKLRNRFFEEDQIRITWNQVKETAIACYETPRDAHDILTKYSTLLRKGAA